MPTPTTWNTFSLQAAMQGVRVGFQNSTNVFDDTATGVLDKWQSKELTSEGEVVQYRVIIKDITVYCNESGVPYDTTGVAAAFPGYTTSALKLYQPEGASTRDTGAKNVTRAIIGGEDSDGNAVISSLEPRDYYAMHILAHMLRNIAKPDQSDVGNITYFCSAAYRWAQGMMNAAAAARTNIPVAQDEVNMRGASTLDQLVEKLTEAIEGGGGGGGTDPNAVHYYNLENGDVKIDGYLEAQQLNANWLLLWDQDSQYESDPYEHYLSVDNDVLKLDGDAVTTKLKINGSPATVISPDSDGAITIIGTGGTTVTAGNNSITINSSGGGGGWSPSQGGSQITNEDIATGAVTNANISSAAANRIQKNKLHDNVGDNYVSTSSITRLLTVLRNINIPIIGSVDTNSHKFLFWSPVAYVDSASGIGSGTKYFYYNGQFDIQGSSSKVVNPILVSVNTVISLCVQTYNNQALVWVYNSASGPTTGPVISYNSDIEAIENAARNLITHSSSSGTTAEKTKDELEVDLFVSP